MPYHYKETKAYLELLPQRIHEKIYTPLSDLKITAWKTTEPVPFEKRTSGKKMELKVGKKWGNLWDCAWFHFTGTVPAAAKGLQVVLMLDVHGEMLVMDDKGNPYRGLTTIASGFAFELGMPGKRVLPMFAKAAGGEKIDLWADAGANDLFGVLKGNGTVKEARIAVCNETFRQFFYDYTVLQELAHNLPKESARYGQIVGTLDAVFNTLTNFTDEEAVKARQLLAKELQKQGGDPSLTISAIGHAHIDLAWLWPVRETLRKGARTFSTVINLMKRYPDYVFGASQAQLYEWMKIHYPTVYADIKKKVKEGRWETQGGVWVEFDTNVSGGEALVRQILYGKRFFKQEFGQDNQILWLPDAFGYNGALPQLLKKSGIPYFMTTKMSWNNTNVIPHHTFHWKGIDGSTVLTHMPPEGTYNSSAAPRAIAKAEKEFLDKSISDRCVLLFGIGDGGGGPGPEHLERLKREKNLSGLAPVVQEPIINFYKQIDKHSSRYKTWTGELYLEKHQGTLTTQARNKKYNRKMEYALRELELISLFGFLDGLTSYPKTELDTLWKEMMLYQFHDILPGSSITRVYDECLPRYAAMLETANELTTKTDQLIAGQINTKSLEEPCILFNSLSWHRDEWMKIKNRWYRVSVPPVGYIAIDLAKPTEILSSISASAKVLENEFLHITFNPDGSIKSCFDKEHQKEIVAPGQSINQLNVYYDKWDAWDFYVGIKDRAPEKFKLQSSSAKIDGPQGIVTQVYIYGQSKLTQKIILSAGSYRLDFVTQVDWKESDKMLRAEFPVDILATESTSDIQFGSIKRPTTRNTSWESAKHEICAHKYVDLSQTDYGVALLNDCKYGHRVEGNVLDINLLRSPGYPDAKADRCVHQFTYSLYPHAGNHLDSRVLQAGYELNIPLRTTETKPHAGVHPSIVSLFNLESDAIIIEAVKKAEDSNDIIVRLYESTGATIKTRLHFGFTTTSAVSVNLLEEEPKKLKLQKDTVDLVFKPFEILTIKVSI